MSRPHPGMRCCATGISEGLQYTSGGPGHRPIQSQLLEHHPGGQAGCGRPGNRSAKSPPIGSVDQWHRVGTRSSPIGRFRRVRAGRRSTRHLSTRFFRPPMARPVVPRMVSTAPARIKMIPIVHRIEMPNTEPKNQQDDTQNDHGRSSLTATRGPAPRSNRSEYVTEPLNAKHDRAHRPSVRGACHHGGTAPW